MSTKTDAILNQRITEVLEDPQYSLKECQYPGLASYLQHPTYTNYTFDFKNTLDYIFYSVPLEKQSPSCHLLSILDVPSHSEINSESPEGSGLPSTLYGSDHLRIEAVFSVNGTK